MAGIKRMKRVSAEVYPLVDGWKVEVWQPDPAGRNPFHPDVIITAYYFLKKSEGWTQALVDEVKAMLNAIPV